MSHQHRMLQGLNSFLEAADSSSSSSHFSSFNNSPEEQPLLEEHSEPVQYSHSPGSSLPGIPSSSSDPSLPSVSSFFVTRVSDPHPSSNGVAPVDSGSTAWLQVFGSFILFMNSWGLQNSYGVFQTFYLDNDLTGHGTSAVSWIGSIQLFLTTFGCFPTGILIDRGYLQSLIATGTVLEAIGLLLTSNSSEYWQLFLAQGICVGLGSGMLALIPVALVSMHFQQKRMLATGIAASGANFAGIVYPLSMRCLFPAIGFPWAVRILALVVCVLNCICLPIMRLRRQDLEGKDAKFSISHFKDLSYAAFVAAFTLLLASSFAPFFFVQDYALELGIDKNMGFYLLAIMNAANLVGRLGPNFLADWYGGINTLIPGCIVCAVNLAIMSVCSKISSLLAVSIIYGFFSGGVFVLPGPIIANLSPDAANIGVRMGLAYLVADFGGLIGNPIFAAVKGDSGHAIKAFHGVWWVAASVMMGSVIALVIARYLRLQAFLSPARI